MDVHPHFVGRDAQLDRLQGYLDLAVSGQGQVCFVTGEAGSGKSALVNVFAQKAQAKDENSIFAVGHCDAFTGMGDPYLPFRELLDMLTGNVEASVAQGSSTNENADRIRKLIQFSGETLIEFGPNLVGLFVPGATLAMRVGRYIGKKSGLGKKLSQLVEGKQDDEDLQIEGIDKSRIVEQYVDVIRKLSSKKTLLIVLEDLHWADEASCGLLFSLSRKLKTSSVLIIGTYRPVEIKLGRSENRHPLEKAVNEIRRERGDITIDLETTMQKTGMEFVNSYLDSEPNQYDAAFRHGLFEHTGGHPLFTVELMRNMREHGDVFRNDDGMWLNRTDLDWDRFPGRVEGVIEEQISRVGESLRKDLTIACVEGEIFTAEVLAHIHEEGSRDVVKRISGSLQDQHMLVLSQGIDHIAEQRLSRYRFRHNLIQNYLYNTIDEAERTYLHEDVGIALETLFGENQGEIAGLLARHFEIAGLAEKASHYLVLAGNEAYRRFGYVEAIGLYDRALNVIKHDPQNADVLNQLYLQRGRAMELVGRYDDAIANYKDLNALGEDLGEDRLILGSTIARTTLHSTPNPQKDLPQAERLSKRAMELAIQLGDEVSQAKILWNEMLRLTFSGGKYEDAVAAGERAILLARKLGQRSLLAYALNDISMTYMYIGKITMAQQALLEAKGIWKELGNMDMMVDTISRLGYSHYISGDYLKAIDSGKEARQISVAVGSLWGRANVGFSTAPAYYEIGNLGKTIQLFQESIQFAEQVGHVSALVSSMAGLAWVFGMIDQIEGAIEVAKNGLEHARKSMLPMLPTASAILARLYLRLGEVELAERTMANARKVLSQGSQLGPYLMAIGEGELALAKGVPEKSIEHVDRLLTRLNEFEMQSFIADALCLKARAHSAMGQLEEASQVSAQAAKHAEELSATTILMEILMLQARIEGSRSNSQESLEFEAKARGIAEEIAANLPDEGQRASFLRRFENEKLRFGT
jgi:tetratricopeptide (TPR) repeat protein